MIRNEFIAACECGDEGVDVNRPGFNDSAVSGGVPVASCSILPLIGAGTEYSADIDSSSSVSPSASMSESSSDDTWMFALDVPPGMRPWLTIYLNSSSPAYSSTMMISDSV